MLLIKALEEKFEVTNGVIIIRKSKDRQYNGQKEKFEVTNGVIMIRKSKDRQYNGQKEKEKQRFTKHYTAN
jgi:uncharacterized protein with PhoU and TrkA domain